MSEPNNKYVKIEKANTFVDPSIVAKDITASLENNLILGNLIYKVNESGFKDAGDTVTVKTQASLTAAAFDGDLSGEEQDITETSTDVTLSQGATSYVKVTAKQLSLSTPQFQVQVIDPLVKSLAQKIDSDIAALYKYIPYYTGTAGTTPDALTDVVEPRTKLNTNKALLQDRSFVIDPDAEGQLLLLEAFYRFDAVGDTMGLRDASMGKKFGFNMFMDQNVKTHTAGTFTAVTTPLTSAAATAGASTIAVDGGSGTETLLIGDLLTIGDYQYVVTANATATSGAIASVSIYPTVQANIADNTAITFPDKTAKASVRNLAFNKYAFAMVSAPMTPPLDGSKSYATNLDSGVNVLITFEWDSELQSNKIVATALYGVAAHIKEAAVVLLG